MKVLLKDIWQAQDAFSKIFNKEYDDPKLSYTLGVKIAKTINIELAGINEQRQKLIL